MLQVHSLVIDIQKKDEEYIVKTYSTCSDSFKLDKDGGIQAEYGNEKTVRNGLELLSPVHIRVTDNIVWFGSLDGAERTFLDEMLNEALVLIRDIETDLDANKVLEAYKNNF